MPAGVCKINVGVWPSSTPEVCTMEGSIECLPCEDIHEVKRRVKEYLEKVAETDDYLRKNTPKLEWFGL